MIRKLYETIWNCFQLFNDLEIRDARKQRCYQVGWCWMAVLKHKIRVMNRAMSIWSSLVFREIAFQRLVDPQKPEAIFGKSDLQSETWWQLQSETWWQNIMNYIMIIIWLKVILWLSHGLKDIKSFRCASNDPIAGGPVPYPCRGRLTWWCWGWSDTFALGELFYCR